MLDEYLLLAKNHRTNPKPLALKNKKTERTEITSDCETSLKSKKTRNIAAAKDKTEGITIELLTEAPPIISIDEWKAVIHLDADLQSKQTGLLTQKRLVKPEFDPE